MNAVRLRRLSKPAVLKRIGRDLLSQLLFRFQRDLQAGPPVSGTLDSGLRTQDSFALPPPEASDDQYFRAVSALLMRPEALPAALNEALCAIDELGSEQGNAVLEADHEWPSKKGLVKPDMTREEIALQLWLADADYVAHVCNKLRLRRLSAFEHAAHPRASELRDSVLECAGARPEGPLALSNNAKDVEKRQRAGALQDLAVVRTPSGPLPALDRAAILALTLDLDAWFVRNGRGSETTRVEVYPMEREYWFLIRHGDLFTRAPKVEQQETHILHFRPERDDVVVYSPALDELRVNARTQGERDLYIRQFGRHLRGSGDYFSDRSTYTLEPLRTAGADALDPRQIEGVEKIRLRELETADLNGEREVITRAVQGLFEFAAANPERPNPISSDGRLARAIFDIQFTGSAKAYPVEIRLPNMLKVSRNCDAALVQDWLLASGFRRTGVSEVSGQVLAHAIASPA